MLTVINEKRRNKAKEETKNRKFTPKDLRMKKTRAFRKKLTKFERTKKTIKQQKKENNFRPRKYALTA